MKVLSLFDGMSCGMLALKKAGKQVDAYYASEIDKFAIKVSKHSNHDIIHLGDVQNIHAKDLPKIDLLIGGSPCQGFSNAGKGLNFDDPRSKLFFEYVRILEELREVNPDIKFLLENVVMKKEWECVITNFLGIGPLKINSALVSAQNRERLYWTNINEGDISQPEDSGIFIKDIIQQDCEINRKYYLSEKAIARIIRKGYSKPKVNPDKSGAINTKNNSGQLSIDSGTTLISGMQKLNTSRESGDRIYGINGKSPSLCVGNRCNTGMPNISLDDELRRLTPIECERLQTVPDNYTSCVSDSQRYKMLGNGWTVDVIAHILKYLK